MNFRRFGSRLVVLAIVAALAAATPSLASGTAAPAPTKAMKAATDLLDINSCSKEELMKLPGIGEAYAQKIVSGRPYKGKDELIQKKLIPEATYKKISGMIIAKQK
jgi:DNA uptake protein ComE-like DNA-binding protein